MSVYDFLSTDDNNFPSLFHPKKHGKDGRALTRFESEEDLHELEIIKETGGVYADIPFYTKLTFIFTIDWQYSEERCKALLEHIKANSVKDRHYELHRIWLANARSKSSFNRDVEQGIQSVLKLSLPLNGDTPQTLKELNKAFDGGNFFCIKFY